MPKAGHGRGAIAAIGLVLLFAGVVGGAVLWVLADREPNKAAASFARAAPGCTTTLTFGEPGEFFVYEELSGVSQAVEGCQPSTLPGRAFTFTVTTANGIEVPRVEDTSMSYDLDVGAATSVARITIEEAGDYRISVLGDDPAKVAAVGGDPEADVEQLRRGAIAAATGGVVLGLLLLWLAGRRSKRAATFAGPLDPGWGVTERDHARRAAAAVDDGTTWPPATTQVPVNPHAPDERRVARIERPPTAPDAAVEPPKPPPAAAAVAGAAIASDTTAEPGTLAAPATDAVTDPPADRPEEPATDEPATDATLADGVSTDSAEEPPTPDGPTEADPAPGPDTTPESAHPDQPTAPLVESGEPGADAAPDDHDDTASGSSRSAEPDDTSEAGRAEAPVGPVAGEDTSSGMWPGSAPVPDDGPREPDPERDGAGDASSEDDTPPA